MTSEAAGKNELARANLEQFMVLITIKAYGVVSLGIYPVAPAGSIWCAFDFSLPYDCDHSEIALWEVRGQGNGQ